MKEHRRFQGVLLFLIPFVAIVALVVLVVGGLTPNGPVGLAVEGLTPAGPVAQGDIINVLTDCVGVMGDGCTNDGPAINRCLLANPGRTFFFPKTRTPYTHPESDYYSGETINVQSGQTLMGDGKSALATRITFTPDCAGSSRSAIPNFDGIVVSDFAVIRNLHFEGALICSHNAATFGARSGTPNVPASGKDGISVRGSWVHLEDVSVCGFGRDGISVTQGDLGVFNGVSSTQNSRYGFYFANAPDSHINTCTGCTAIQNQVAGLHDSSRGNTFINMLFDSNVFASAEVMDHTGSLFITPWFETVPPKLGMQSLVISPTVAMGNRPDWSKSPSWIETDVANGGGYTRFVNLIAQPEEWVDGRPVNARSPVVFGTGTPSGFQGQPTSWYVRNILTLATVAFGESAERGWWCIRSLGWDQPGLASSSICFADAGPDGVHGNWQADGSGGPTRAWLPNGVYLGSGTTERRINVRVEGRAPSGSCTPGVDDIVFADSFAAGGHIGWVCLDVGTWQTFGVISSDVLAINPLTISSPSVVEDPVVKDPLSIPTADPSTK